MEIETWIAKTRGEHDALAGPLAKDGYRFRSLSIYGPVSQPLFAAVMVKRSKVVAQHAFPCETREEFLGTFGDQAELGFGPVCISATGSTAHPRFATLYQKLDPIPLTRIDLGSGGSDDEETLQGMSRIARESGSILRSLASYGSASQPVFAAVWRPNPDAVVWNVDGLVETRDEYLDRYQAQTAGWCRPSLITPHVGGGTSVVYVDDQVNAWSVTAHADEAACQSHLDRAKQDGSLPFSLQAAGETRKKARYAVISAPSDKPIARAFHASGPRTNGDIDAVVEEIMRASSLRHASLAIVNAGHLVYTKGYTWAEPGWPIAEPTTYFRLGSVSKVVSALATYQLIEEEGAASYIDKFTLESEIQPIVDLRTPSGGLPGTGWDDITVRHLLEHTSGIPASAHRPDVKIRDLHRTEVPGKTWNLPVDTAMTDRYIASQTLTHTPGTAYDGYNNCGYYMLGRVLKARRGTTRPIDAMQPLLDPLGITRIRRARDRIEDQHDDDARYRVSRTDKLPDIDVRRSVMSEDQPLVPTDYGGNLRLEKFDGTGGLTAAATDIGRILAVLTHPGDSPALPRTTVEQMLDNGAANQAMWGGRAGHGLDGVKALGGGAYRGRKGGSLPTVGCWFWFSGDWGYVMTWAGKVATQFTTAEYTKGLKPVMDIARNVAWPTADLFEDYGMAAFT